MIRPWLGLLCIVIAATTACYQPSLGDCLVTCEAATACPAGYACGGNGYCHPGGEAEGDCTPVTPDAEPDPDSDRVVPDAEPPAAASLHGLAAGMEFTCGIDADGLLYCWGANYAGQLGLGSTSVRTLAPTTPVVGLVKTWSAVTTTARAACGIARADGSLHCWGDNAHGMLGRGGGVGGVSGLPAAVVAVPTPGPWTVISGGDEHVCGINAGRAFCWGLGSNGQLGDGAGNASDDPVQVGTATDWVDLAAGLAHTCGIRDEGGARNLYCWGAVTGLGLSPTPADNVLAPGAATLHPQSKDWLAVTVGFYNTCAIDEDRDLWCWGSNGQGLILTSGATPVLTPALIEATLAWDQVKIGYGHACARAGGVVRCWAQSDEGQAGVHPASAGFHTIPGIWNEVTVGVQGHHSCGVRSDGAACWGYNASGQLGADIAGDALVPTRAETTGEPDKEWRAISAGATVTCAIARSDGSIWCWGYDTGVLQGFGDQGRPRRLDALGTGWAKIDADFSHACAIKTADESLWCWGLDNSQGQLGNGGSGSPGEVINGGAWRDVGVGYSATCGVKTDGTLWCWGSDLYGLLGDPGSALTRTAPRQVVVATNGWNSVSVGAHHACAVRSVGSAACWGYNSDHAVDDASPDTVIESPTDLPAQAGSWLAIDASPGDRSHTAALAGTARLAWGNALYGRVGLDLGPALITTPTGLAGETADWTAITTGNEHGCGLRAGGQLWCWGYSANAPTGDGTYVGSYTPVQVGTDGGWLEVSAGGRHSCAIDALHHARCWGINHALQIGAGLGMTPTPVAVVMP